MKIVHHYQVIKLVATDLDTCTVTHQLVAFVFIVPYQLLLGCFCQHLYVGYSTVCMISFI